MENGSGRLLIRLGFFSMLCLDLSLAYTRAANLRMPTLEQPWELLVCFDEFSQGHQLTCANTKNFNFAELGEEVLHKDSTWMIPIMVRSCTVTVLCKKAHAVEGHPWFLTFGEFEQAVVNRIHMILAQVARTAGARFLKAFSWNTTPIV